MSHTRDVFRRLAMLGLALCVLIAGGTVAYALVEDRNLWDGFVWTVDTVATTGSIQAPQDTAGEIVKVVLTFLGVGTLFYALVSLTELVVTGELGTLLSERRARRMTERLRDHYIVCGFGRVGRQVASDLRAAGAPYVVIDEDPTNREAAYAPGVRFITARPSDDEALRDAGIARARAIVACVDSDAENIFIALTARELRPDIAIVARAEPRGEREQAAPRRRRPRDLALQVLRHRDGAARPAPERHRHDGRRRRVPAGGDHRAGAARRAPRRRSATSAAAPTSSASATPTAPSGPSPRPTRCCAAGDVVMAIGTPRTLERLEELFTAGSRVATAT